MRLRIVGKRPMDGWAVLFSLRSRGAMQPAFGGGLLSMGRRKLDSKSGLKIRSGLHKRIHGAVEAAAARLAAGPKPTLRQWIMVAVGARDRAVAIVSSVEPESARTISASVFHDAKNCGSQRALLWATTMR